MCEKTSVPGGITYIHKGKNTLTVYKQHQRSGLNLGIWCCKTVARQAIQ